MKRILFLIWAGLLGGVALAQAPKSPAKNPVERLAPAALEEDSPLQAGLQIRGWQLGVIPIDRYPNIPAATLPNVAGISPNLTLADYLKTYPRLDPNYSAAIEVKGYFEAPESKTYLLKLRLAGYGVLQLDGKNILIVENQQGVHEREVEVYLEKGLHRLRIEHTKSIPASYREMTLWLYNDSKKDFEYVPNSYFRCHALNQKTEGGNKRIAGEGARLIEPGDNSPLEAVHPSFTRWVLNKQSFQPRVGGIDFLPDGRMVLCSWDSLGQVFLLSGVETGDTNQIRVKQIAKGLAEPLGIKVVDGEIYVLQKQELTKLVDLDKDDIIDRYQTICNAWGATGNFHEFSFGLEYKDGFFYAALAIAINPGGRSTIPQNKDRGKAIKIAKDGSSYEFIASGLRTPNGIGQGSDGEIFIADNQGDWLPSCKIVHLKKEAFYNNYAVELQAMGTKKVYPPVVWLPQNEIGNSTSQPSYLKEGPWKGHLIFGDVTYGGLQRAFVERVKRITDEGDTLDYYQGAAFKFSQGFNGGVNRIAWGPDGALYIGEVGNPGNWGQYGKNWWGLEKIKYNGTLTFEMLAVRARANGMEIELTKPLKAGFGDKIEDWRVETWRYIPTMKYGGNKENQKKVTPSSVLVSADRKRVFLELEGLEDDQVVYINPRMERVRSTEDERLWTNEAWYTLNLVPEEKYPVPTKPQAKKTAQASPAVAPKPVAKPAVAKLDPAAEALAIKEGSALIETKGCRACHAMDKKVLGPAYREVAAKYRGDATALKRLVAKVQNGGGGVWGEYAMAAQSHVGKEDITKMVKYILSLK